jgi:hypothetical protein
VCSSDLALDGLGAQLAEVRAALLAPGCLTEEKTASGPTQVSYLPLMRGVRLLTLRSLIQAGQGQPDQAAREIGALVDRLLVLEQECAPSLITAMILTVSLQHLARGLGFALAHPALSRGTEAEIWRRLARLEQRPTPIPGALRWEARWLRALLEQPVDFTTVAQESRGERGAKAPWPLYDKQATLTLHDRLARRNVWLAGQPLDAAAWARPSSEDEYLERLRRQPRLLSWLRWNSVGTTLLAVARPAMAKYSLKWHRDRCLLAAQRARWLRDLRQRGRAPALEAPPPLDPFRQQPFTGLEGAPVCGVPRSFLAGDEKLRLGSDPPPLPPPPGAAASQPRAAP